MPARRPRWLAVAGARPNFVKVAPLVRAARAAGIALPWVHTGQHFDARLSGEILGDLGLPPPVAHLDIGAGTSTRQTARILERLEPVLETRRPDVLVVVGDVTSTLAATIAAGQRDVPVAHVEAGLRSFDETMPEERNRVLVDRWSRRLYVTEPSGVRNLRREGIAPDRIRLVGNPMVDALREALPEVRRRLSAAGTVSPTGVLVTLHRPSNVDDLARLRRWCRALATVATRVPVTFPVHPRTRGRLEQARLWRSLVRAGVRLTEPLGYLDFLAALSAAEAVLTDSGGVQEEASVLGVPCLTLRTTTERPMTVTHGTNRLVGDRPEVLPREVARVRREAGDHGGAASGRRGRLPARLAWLWDGAAARRIVEDLRGLPGAR